MQAFDHNNFAGKGLFSIIRSHNQFSMYFKTRALHKHVRSYGSRNALASANSLLTSSALKQQETNTETVISPGELL